MLPRGIASFEAEGGFCASSPFKTVQLPQRSDSTGDHRFYTCHVKNTSDVAVHVLCHGDLGPRWVSHRPKDRDIWGMVFWCCHVHVILHTMLLVILLKLVRDPSMPMYLAQ